MHQAVDLQYFANKWTFEHFAHIDLFEDLNEIITINSNLSHFPIAYVPLMLGILIYQNDNQQTLS